jgi:two-component system, NtrC family, response regulator AtoC
MSELRPGPAGTAGGGQPPRAARGQAERLHMASLGPVAALIGRVAGSDVTVLLRGEPGTGKALVARAIHGASPRRQRPFIKIDCGAPPERLGPELFGCEQGAIAGAGQHRPGRLEFAHHGTLFLDHVSELPAPLQARLEAVLEQGRFARVGARDPVRAEMRLIASSERDLAWAVAEGRFQPALFSRLNVVCLTLPPLRQRRAELREITQFFVRRYATHYNRPEVPLSRETLRLFSEYRWPANVHELEGAIKRIFMLGSEATVCEELARAMRQADQQVAARLLAARGAGADRGAMAGAASRTLKEIARRAAGGAERELIFSTLQRTRWNRREAARILRVSYKALLSKIKRAALDGPS